MAQRLTLQALAETLIRESRSQFTVDEYVAKIEERWHRRIAPATLNHLKDKLNHHDCLIEINGSRFLPCQAVLEKVGHIPLILQPGPKEWETGVLIPGHRLVPFVSGELNEYDLTFLDPEGNEIPKGRHSFFIDDIIHYFQYSDERHFPDQIKVNQLVPGKSTLSLTGWDLKGMIASKKLAPGDALELRIQDYDNGVFVLKPLSAGRLRRDRIRMRSVYVGIENVLQEVWKQDGNKPSRLDKQLLQALHILAEKGMDLPGFSLPGLMECLEQLTIVRDDHHELHLAPAHRTGPEPYVWEVIHHEPTGRTGSLQEIFEDMGLAFSELEFKAILYSVMATEEFDIEAVFDLLFGAKRDCFYDKKQHNAFYRHLRKLLNEICEDLKCSEPKLVTDIRSQTVAIKMRMIQILRYLESQGAQLEDIPGELLEYLADIDGFCSDGLTKFSNRLEPPDVKTIRDIRTALQMLAPNVDLIEDEVYNNLRIY